MKFIISDNVKDVMFSAMLLNDKGNIKGLYSGLKVGDLVEIIAKLGDDYGKMCKKKNFWKGFAIGSFALWFYYDIKSQKEISRLKQENEVLKDEYIKVVDDEQDKA